MEKLRQFYGLQIAEYCNNKKLELTKVKCGAIQLDNCIDITECSRIIKNKIEENDHVVKPHNIPEWLSKKQILPFEQKIYKEKNPYLRNINLKVILKDKSACISIKHFSNKCILDRTLSARNIYNNIIKARVNTFDTIEIDPNFSNHLIPILEQFRKNHIRHSYKYHLDQILNKKSTGGCSNRAKQLSYKIDEIEINITELGIFLKHIFKKVVPLELFGSHKNERIIISSVYRILNSARYQPIYLKKYISWLNIDQIKWLKFIKEESVKWLFISKLIIWFIIKYLYSIFNRVFFWTVHPEAIGKRLFIKIGKWKIIKRNFIKDKIRHNILIEAFENNLTSPKCELKLLIKSSGIRPIVKTSYNTEEKAHITILLKFLSQLCVKEYGIATMAEFRDKFKAIVPKRNNFDNECKKKWLISCDIDDAFGSVKLDKLNNIIRILCQDLPNKLFLEWVACVSVRDKTGDVKYEQYFSTLPQALPNGTIFAPSNIKVFNRPTYMMKEKLLDDIEKCIFDQKVTINQKEYFVRKGILQGRIISSILSDIYYNYIYNQKLSGFMNSGLLFRYVDDTLYLSENRESAEEFLKIINEGFPEYNCSYKRSKIQTNLPNQIVPATNEIIFLGYKINCDSLESLPYFKDAHPAHLFTLAMKDKHYRKSAILIFKQRIINCSYLRLSKMILRHTNTSVFHLILFVKKISIMQAWRAYMYIEKLFGTSHKLYRYHQQIFFIMKKSNKKIVLIFLKHYMEGVENDFNRYEIRNKVLLSLWAAYECVFSNNKVMQNLFINGIRKEINMQKKNIKRLYIYSQNH